MLQDELEPLRDLIRDLTSTHGRTGEFTLVRPADCVPAVHEACDKIRIAWLKAFFSETGDTSLKRYFNFHQEGIREISDSLFVFSQTNDLGPEDATGIAGMNDAICSLVTHIQNHHPAFFDDSLNSPLCLRVATIGSLSQKLSALGNKIADADLHQDLKNCLMAYFRESRQAQSGGFYSYHAISYFEMFIEKLTGLFSLDVPGTGDVDTLLSGIDFNRLDFFLYRSTRIRHSCLEITDSHDRIHFLREKKVEVVLSSNHQAAKCQPGFPSLTLMLENWLDEEIGRIESEASAFPVVAVRNSSKKIALDLSVAQIACFIRVIHGCKIVPDSTLADIFRFVSANFSSKMQDDISERSLSKEYYTVSQSTARKLMDIIQRFLDNLRGGFFPLLAVASVIFGIS